MDIPWGRGPRSASIRYQRLAREKWERGEVSFDLVPFEGFEGGIPISRGGFVGAGRN